MLLHEGDVDRFVEAWGKAVAALYPQGPASEDYTSIVNVRHYDRLRGLLDDAQAKGARVVETGPSPEQAKGRAHTLPPTLVLDVHDDMRIMQEEIFGPLLPIVTYRDLDEAIAFVNARPRPLALYYFGSSATNRTRVLTRTTSGGVTINGTLLHYAQDDLPFGGVGAERLWRVPRHRGVPQVQPPEGGVRRRAMERRRAAAASVRPAHQHHPGLDAPAAGQHGLAATDRGSQRDRDSCAG